MVIAPQAAQPTAQHVAADHADTVHIRTPLIPTLRFLRQVAEAVVAAPADQVEVHGPDGQNPDQL